ncbi:class A beta-lactamase [Phenylobacterium sp.]|uniref:class A beta-lactamase n=1 Tax=Phenylobacterium sp. TaxID=1871053 RepID=UPI0039834EEB
MLRTASTTPPLDGAALNEAMQAFAARARPAQLGLGLTNLESGEHWTLNGDRRFPMQSVFKLALGAAALAEVDARRLTLDRPFVLEEEQLSPQHSPIAAAWPGRRDYTARELLVAAVSDSDNTAADVLMKHIGGPGAVTAWLQGRKINEIRIDRYEREMQPEVYGMASFRAAWRSPAGFAAARAAVPPAQRMAAARAYMADPRDTATPRNMLDFLTLLNAGELISPVSTRLLLQILTDTQRGADRLKAGFPNGTTFAHKVGTSGTDQGLNTAFNDVGIFTLPDKRSYAVALFMSGSTLDENARSALFADIGQALASSVG